MRYASNLILTVAILAGLAGCGSTRALPESAGRNIAPVVRGSQDGLEVRWWVVAGTPEQIGARLHPWQDGAVPIDPEVKALWARHGMRIIAVPLDEVSVLKDRFRLVSGVQRQWFGQVPFWTEMVRGPSRNAGQLVALERGRLALTAGTLRLLVRAWTTPAPDDRGVRPEMHVEIVPQHHESHPAVDPEAMLGLAPTPREPERQGLLFTRLRATLTCDKPVAYIIVPEAPDVTWTDEVSDAPRRVRAQRAPESAGPALGQVVRSVPARDVEAPAPQIEAEPIGPPSTRVRTLGEAMLAAPRPGYPDEEVRAMVLLVPRIPDEYTLLR